MTEKGTLRSLSRPRDAVLFAPAALCLCLTLAGCATTGVDGGTGYDDPTRTVAAAPPGMSLGAPYFSALGEPCREVLPADGATDRPGAFCLRNGAWELVPDMYTAIPAMPDPDEARRR
jgi:hypothetical protein